MKEKIYNSEEKRKAILKQIKLIQERKEKARNFYDKNNLKNLNNHLEYQQSIGLIPNIYLNYRKYKLNALILKTK